MPTEDGRAIEAPSLFLISSLGTLSATAALQFFILFFSISVCVSLINNGDCQHLMMWCLLDKWVVAGFEFCVIQNRVN